MSQIMIEATGLCKYYGDFVAVEDVSFQVESGAITAFLGPNGAGKSTIIKMITGFMSATKGTTKIAGFDIRKDRIEIAKRIGYLPENGPLYNDMTPAQLLKFMGSARGMDPSFLRERTEYVINACELSTVIYKPIGKLSKGFRQRVGLANAMLHDPEVLILDEPTSGLDPNQIQEARELLRSSRVNKTILISTHILQEVVAIAQRVLLINEGRLVYQGTPQDLGRTPEELEQKFHQITGHRTAKSA